MDRPTVLVTGLSGLIGGAVRRQLGARYELRALNRRAVEGVACHQADIADLGAIEPAFKGVDAVVHLAASVGSSAPFDEILRANVVGTYNVFEAARRAGVRRVVYASSGATVSGCQRDIARMLEACLRAPDTLRFEVFFAVSNNVWGYRDLDHARRVLGWEPLDAAETYR